MCMTKVKDMHCAIQNCQETKERPLALTRTPLRASRQSLSSFLLCRFFCLFFYSSPADSSQKLANGDSRSDDMYIIPVREIWEWLTNPESIIMPFLA